MNLFLATRRRLIDMLEAVSPNVLLLEDDPALDARLAALLHAVAEEADRAARALTDPDA